MPYPLEAYIATAVAMLVIGMSKGGFGATLSVIALPLLSLIMPVEAVLGSMLPILMFADVLAAGFHWRYWNARYLVLLVPGAIFGVVLGTIFITSVSSEILRTAMGVIILLFTTYKFFEKRLLKLFVYKPHRWHGVLAGGFSGLISTIAHIGGPPIAIYLLLQDVQPRVFVATSALFFLLLNWIKVPFYIYADLFDLSVLREVWWLLIMVPIGVLIGRWFVTRVRKEVFDRLILTVLTLAGLMLVLG